MNDVERADPEDEEPEVADGDTGAEEENGIGVLLRGDVDTDTEDVDPTRGLDPYAALAFTDPDVEGSVSPEARLEQGNHLIANGQVNDAIHQYREAVRGAESEDAGVANRVTLGDAYAYSGQALNAFCQYRRAIKTSPRKAEPHFSLAELFQRYGRLQSAIGEYRKAISFAPTNAYYRYKLGDALSLAGDAEGAVSELEEASHLKPQDGFYHFWLGDLYMRVNRFDEAIREMQQATIFSPYDAYYNVRLGALYRRINMVNDAIDAVHHAVKITPTNGAYHCLLADLYSEARLDSQSMYHYQAAGNLDDYDIENLRRLRRLCGLEEDVMLALDMPEND